MEKSAWRFFFCFLKDAGPVLMYAIRAWNKLFKDIGCYVIFGLKDWSESIKRERVFRGRKNSWVTNCVKWVRMWLSFLRAYNNVAFYGNWLKTANWQLKWLDITKVKGKVFHVIIYFTFLGKVLPGWGTIITVTLSFVKRNVKYLGIAEYFWNRF